MFSWVANGGFNHARVAYAIETLAISTSESEYLEFASRLRTAILTLNAERPDASDIP